MITDTESMSGSDDDNDDVRNNERVTCPFDNLPEEVIANICSCFMKNSTTNLVERKAKKQQDFSANSLFEYEDFFTVNIDDLIDIYPLSLLNRTIRNKILNNNHLWNEEMVVDLSDFSKSTKLFKYMNKINDWNYNSSDDELIVAVERERLNIALNFLSCLGLSDYIKKLKVSCILKEVGLKESISWSKLIVSTFPNLTDLIYYSLTDRNVVQRYETLDCSQGKWENLSTVRVYFDFNTLNSILEHHKSTVTSISFAPRVSDQQSTEDLLKNTKLLNNVASVNVDMKFNSSMLESNKDYLDKLGAIIISCSDVSIPQWLPRLSHLKRIVVEKIFTTNLELSDINFINLNELVLGFEHQSNLTLKNIHAPELHEIGVINAAINASSMKSFENLRSIKFSNCGYDQEYWISSHPALKYFSLFFSEFTVSDHSRSFSLCDNQSLLSISLCSLESVSISNINSASKLYLEKCGNIQINTDKISEIYIQNYSPTNISINVGSCTKLHLPKNLESCKLRLKSLNNLSCYYVADYMKILPVEAHNICLDTLYISAFDPPMYLQQLLTSFKHIGLCKYVLSSDHTYSKVFYNISPNSTIVNDMSNNEKIITHKDISLLSYLMNCSSLHTLISGSKLFCLTDTIYSSNSLTHLEVSIANFSNLIFPNLKELIISHSENIDIDISQYPHLQDFSVTNSRNVSIQNTSDTMEKMKFFLLDSISTLSITVNNVKAPNLREAIIHSIKSIKEDTTPIFNLVHSPKLLFHYVSFVWKPALKQKPCHISNRPNNTLTPTPTTPTNQQNIYNKCQLL